jgi:Ceramidase
MQHLTAIVDQVGGSAPQASGGSLESSSKTSPLHDFCDGGTWARIRLYRELWAGATLSVVGFASLAWAGRSSPIASQYIARVPYCEAVREGIFAQPVNTLSNLAYGLSGLLIMYMIGRDREHGQRPNDMGSLAPLFGWVAILLGLTSSAFHGTLSHWGGIADNIAMNLLVSLVFVHNVVRLQGWTTRTFGMLYVSLNVAMTLYLIHDDSGSLRLFAVLVVAEILSECMVIAPKWFPWVRNRLLRRRLGSLGHAVGSFAAGWGVWRLSDTGGPLCSPDRLVQGHAAWHVFTSLTILFLYLYLRSEGAPSKRVDTSICGEAKLGVDEVRLV